SPGMDSAPAPRLWLWIRWHAISPATAGMASSLSHELRIPGKPLDFTAGGAASSAAQSPAASMTDPTVQIIQYCFLGSLGLFAVAAALKHQLRFRRKAAAGDTPPPPPVPLGKVAVWPYRPVDFLMMGMIFL